MTLERFRPTERFSDRAAAYARHRPSYPKAAVDLVLEGLGDPSRLVAADVGAGTGISARLLADRGALVHAIEPNDAMRTAAAPHPRVVWHVATAQATGVPDETVDLVLCAQAFHWFDEDATLVELHRILRPGGRLALLWNRREEQDATTRGYYALVHAAAEPEHGSLGDSRFDPRRVETTGLFTRPTRTETPNRQSLDEEGLVGRALSASYVPTSGPRHDALVVGLRAHHRSMRDAKGLVTLVYRTEVWRATRTGNSVVDARDVETGV